MSEIHGFKFTHIRKLTRASTFQSTIVPMVGVLEAPKNGAVVYAYDSEGQLYSLSHKDFHKRFRMLG